MFILCLWTTMIYMYFSKITHTRVLLAYIEIWKSNTIQLQISFSRLAKTKNKIIRSRSDSVWRMYIILYQNMVGTMGTYHFIQYDLVLQLGWNKKLPLAKYYSIKKLGINNENIPVFRPQSRLRFKSWISNKHPHFNSDKFGLHLSF